MTEELYSELKMIYSWNSEYKHYFNEDLRKLYTSNISSTTLELMESKIRSKLLDPETGEHYFRDELRYLMFSGHDDNIYPFMR
jgi:hypothetical protein